MIIYNIPLVRDQQIAGGIEPGLNVLGTDVEVRYVSSPDVLPRLSVDTPWHFAKYGFPLPASDINNYFLHYSAWKDFSKEEEEWCLIVEQSVKLDADASVIEQDIQALQVNWDVYFPFDRLRIYEEEKKATFEINKSLVNPNFYEWFDPLPYFLGFAWGSSIYFLSKQGCHKLLEGTQIRQRVDDEIVCLSIEEKMQTFSEEVPWFDFTRQPKVRSVDRNIAIFEAITKNSRWTAERKNMVRVLLKNISDLGTQLGIDLLLQGGTHLGYIRHGGIMPWDDDVDLGIEEKDIAELLAGIDKLPGLAYQEVIEQKSSARFYKVWMKNGEPIQGYPYTFPLIDIWLFNKRENDLVFINGIVCPNSARYPYQKVVLENAEFKMTGNSIEVLDSRYRTWKKGIRVYNFHHSLERSQGFPLRVEITVDSNGRMLGVV